MNNRPFWVIERYVNNSLQYWSIGARGKCSRDDYAPSIDDATKFFDDSSAMRALIHSCDGNGRIVEHQYAGAGQ